MSCQIVARVSSELALTEFHSLSPPCDHSAETPGPLMPQPGALLAGSSIHDGFSTGSCRTSALMPRMFSASYQRYSLVVVTDWRATVPVAVFLACKLDTCAPFKARPLSNKTDSSKRCRLIT